MDSSSFPLPLPNLQASPEAWSVPAIGRSEGTRPQAHLSDDALARSLFQQAADLTTGTIANADLDTLGNPVGATDNAAAPW
jgi:hypothetical protein